MTLIATGGLRTAPDFGKALALGADAIALSNSAMQAIGCIAMRACSSINCPVGIATQREDLRRRLEIAASATRLKNFLKDGPALDEETGAAAGMLGASEEREVGTIMQRTHRIRHRIIWLVLGPVAAAALIYALANRVEMPVMDTVPGAAVERGAE